jgi:8-oxo-dGTP pyrophosphatase MutT (NUDIX family)
VTLIIVQNDEILLIDRRRNGRSYYVIPGGGVEAGESLAQAAIREAQEELSLDVVLGPLLYTRPWDDGRFQQMEYAFLVENYRGKPILQDPEILAKQTPDNIYRLQWLPLAELNGSPCYPGPIEAKVMQQANGKQ